MCFSHFRTFRLKETRKLPLGKIVDQSRCPRLYEVAVGRDPCCERHRTFPLSFLSGEKGDGYQYSTFYKSRDLFAHCSPTPVPPSLLISSISSERDHPWSTNSILRPRGKKSTKNLGRKPPETRARFSVYRRHRTQSSSQYASVQVLDASCMEGSALYNELLLSASPAGQTNFSGFLQRESIRVTQISDIRREEPPCNIVDYQFRSKQEDPLR